MTKKIFKKILILTKTGLELKEDTMNKIKEIAKDSHVEFVEFEEFKKIHLNDRDLVITIGGDGTFVKAGNLIKTSHILGINSDPDASEGALTSLNLNEIDKLISILNGDFYTSVLSRIQTKLNGKILDELAINEVYIGAISQFHSSRYVIKFKGKEEEQRSSGVIISTGTGSSAWYKSAGGKVFHPDAERLEFVVREPYIGKKVFKSTIFNGIINKGEKIILESRRDFGGIVSINDSVYDFNKGDVVEVELSDNPLKAIIPIKQA